MKHEQSSMSEFVVLTGFLGSGKTTLLVDFLAQPEAVDTAVIINEVGQINIDGAVIAETGRGLPVALLSSGCVCCSVVNDLLYTIEALIEGRREADQPPFRRIVLECSGLSRPAAVLRSLGQLALLAMPTHIIATMDSAGSPLDLGFEDAVAQLTAAQTIVLTKVDQRSEVERAEGRARVRQINPLALLVDTDDRRKRALAAFLPEKRTDETRRRHGNRFRCTDGTMDHPRIEIVLATFPDPPRWSEMEEWLENLAGLCGNRLLRLKGIVHVAGTADLILVQAVGTFFSAPRRILGNVRGMEGLVIIARDITLRELRETQPGSNVVWSRNEVPVPAEAKRIRQKNSAELLSKHAADHLQQVL